jgi:hypothetical protein
VARQALAAILVMAAQQFHGERGLATISHSAANPGAHRGPGGPEPRAADAVDDTSAARADPAMIPVTSTSRTSAAVPDGGAHGPPARRLMTVFMPSSYPVGVRIR